MSNNHDNLYLPVMADVVNIIEENSQIKTFVLAFPDEQLNNSFEYEPGQFMMVSMPHCGEAPISISSSPTKPGTIDLSVRLAGKLTAAMHQLSPGDKVGLRGPYGRPFPMADLVGHDLLFVAGGIGLAPLRSVINTCLAQDRDSKKKITILYGSRTPSDIAFQTDLDGWRETPGVDCQLTVDVAEPGWGGAVGLVTALLDGIDLEPKQAKALLCGPALMIKAVLARLADFGFQEKDILTTLERHMKCGIGVCRHCHMDSKLVCKDGPVFTMEELQQLEVAELAP